MTDSHDIRRLLYILSLCGVIVAFEIFGLSIFYDAIWMGPGHMDIASRAISLLWYAFWIDVISQPVLFYLMFTEPASSYSDPTMDCITRMEN